MGSSSSSVKDIDTTAICCYDFITKNILGL